MDAGIDGRAGLCSLAIQPQKTQAQEIQAQK
jgi:hypothetical protein